jgi:hypothetical protein
MTAGSTAESVVAGAAAIAELARQSRAQSAMGSFRAFLIVCFIREFDGRARRRSSPTVTEAWMRQPVCSHASPSVPGKSDWWQASDRRFTPEGAE